MSAHAVSQTSLGRAFCIIAVSILVGPAIAGTAMCGIVIFHSLVVYSYTTSLDALPSVWWGMIWPAYLFGSFYAFLTSGIFALVSELAGRRQLFVALLVALSPVVFLLVIGGPSTLHKEASLWIAVIVVIIVTTTICWYLTRRWHSPSP